MSRRRRRGGNPGAFILVAILLVLWYFGAIPGLPPIGTGAEPLHQLATLVPSIVTISTLPPATPIAPVTPLGQRTKTSGCVAASGLPDAACTPGSVFAGVTREQVCTPGYTAQVRNVPADVKAEAYAEYGITSHEPGQYEVDHLVPLELGGSNDIANLWPEPGAPAPGFHEKDQLENYLHDQVCSGSVSLQQAQSVIAHDWYSAYQGMPK